MFSLRAACLKLAAFLCLAVPLAPACAGDAFTPAQREEVVRILREALRNDPSILRDAVTALQADEAQRQSEAARNAIRTRRDELVAQPGDPVAGNPRGDVTVVEFFDTRCPYCRRLLPTMAELLRDDPYVRVVYKDLPILGAASVMESRALLAAQRQGGYLKLQAALMHGPTQATQETIRAAAEQAGLDPNLLLTDMADPAIQQRLDANIRLAQALNIQGTPALVVGQRLVPGAIELADLRQMVAEARRAAPH